MFTVRLAGSVVPAFYLSSKAAVLTNVPLHGPVNLHTT
jgi:hypothetical protein